MTVRRLLSDLRAFGVTVRVDGSAIVWEADDPPDHLLDVLGVLRTGARAVLSGRRWYGFDANTGKPCGPRPNGSGMLAFGALDPNAKVPANVSYLACEGDTSWDRIDPDARRELPYLFASEVGRSG